jgi:uncharacterized membrane protein
LAPFIITALSFAASMFFYSRLPDQIATHWGGNSQPNGFMPKMIGAFIAPVLCLIVICGNAFLIKYILRITKKHPIKTYMQTLSILISTFLLYIHLVTLLYNSGVQVNVTAHVLIATAIFITAMSIPLIFVFKKSSYAPESKELENIEYDKENDLYSDKLITITDDAIVLNKYYFPIGSKKRFSFIR